MNQRPFIFYLTIESIRSEVEAYDFYASKFKYDPIRDSPAYSIQYNGKITFKNQVFTDLKTVDDNESIRCNSIFFEVWRLCVDGYKLFWSSHFTTDMGDWNLDDCSVKVQPVENDAVLQCLLKGTESNMLSAPTVLTASIARDYNNGPPLETQIPRIFDQEYDNCRPFKEMLEMASSFVCSGVQGIISDFFQINPLVASDINYVTGAINRWTNILCAAKSDILFPAETNATIELISWPAVMKDLYFLFEVQWYVDSDFFIHIEHESYFFNNIGLDLTTPQYKNYLKGTLNYSYQKQDIVSEENWIMPESTAIPGSTTKARETRVTLRYTDSCGQINRTVKDYRLEMLYVNLRLLFKLNQLSLQECITNQGGVVLMACSYNPGTDHWDIYGASYNLEMVMATLMHQLHRKNRPLKSNVVIDYSKMSTIFGPLAGYNDEGDVFTLITDFYVQSSNVYKKGNQISIPYCCDLDFNLSNLIKTGLGVGKVRTAQFDPKGNSLTLELTYKDNASPIPFTPASLTGLQLYLNADTGIDTSGGGFIWNDARSTGIFATQPNASEQPSIVADVLSGKNALQFDGVDDGLKVQGLDVLQGCVGSIVMIVRVEDPTPTMTRQQIIGTYRRSAADPANDQWDINLKGEADHGYAVYNYSSDVTGPFDSALPATGEMTIGRSGFENLYYDRQWICLIANVNNVRGFHFLSNNGKFGEFDNFRNIFTPVPGDDINIGKAFWPADNHAFKGKIGTLMIFNRELTGIEIQKINIWAQEYYHINMSIHNYGII